MTTASATKTKVKKTVRTSMEHTPERFNANTASIQGEVYKIWPSPVPGDDTIFARVELDQESGQDDKKPARITIAFRDGEVAGRPFNLLRGEHIQISGYIADFDRAETLENFLTKCKRRDLIEEQPKLAEIVGIAKLQRPMTCLIPIEKDSLDGLSKTDYNDLVWDNTNSALLEGVVAATWAYAGHGFIRLAVYDEHTKILQKNGNRPKRRPHYITVQLTDGKIGDIAIELLGKNGKPKPNTIRRGDRIKIQGRFSQTAQWDNLREFIIKSGHAAVLSELPDTDRYNEIRFSSPMTVVEAQWFVQFT
ncbi:MAG: hypothetical protein RBT34_13110 [Anaerolineaceae bacterium]|jgi:hypothetical protein|nr:hypothetical protein [Anaerolineaceae bacterium]